MIKLKFKRLKCLIYPFTQESLKETSDSLAKKINYVYDNNHYDIQSDEFECHDIYAYNLIKLGKNNLVLNYSIKHDATACGIKKYDLYFDECTLVELNNELIWHKPKKML